MCFPGWFLIQRFTLALGFDLNGLKTNLSGVTVVEAYVIYVEGKVVLWWNLCFVISNIKNSLPNPQPGKQWKSLKKPNKKKNYWPFLCWHSTIKPILNIILLNRLLNCILQLKRHRISNSNVYKQLFSAI